MPWFPPTERMLTTSGRTVLRAVRCMQPPRRAASPQHAPWPARWRAAASASAPCEATRRWGFTTSWCCVAAWRCATCKAAVRWLAGTLPNIHRRALHPACRCPQFTNTAMVRGMQQADAAIAAETMRETGGRLLTVEQVRMAGARASRGGWYALHAACMPSAAAARMPASHWLMMQHPTMPPAHLPSVLRRWPRQACTCSRIAPRLAPHWWCWWTARGSSRSARASRAVRAWAEWDVHGSSVLGGVNLVV